MRCSLCTNKVTYNEATELWDDVLGPGCVASFDGMHHPVGEPPC